MTHINSNQAQRTSVETSLLVQHLRAPNDPNGNPQRLWVVYRPDTQWGYSDTIEVHDEGYSDKPEHLREYISLPDIDISRADYHRRLRNARRNGTLRASY